jgi:hypothetical protein
MKIAIPTDDGIMLSAYANSPKGYLILTTAGGEIVNEELRWNKLSEILTSENGNMYNLVDCSAIIVGGVTKELQNFLNPRQIEPVTTKEVIITKIIMEYLSKTLARESNYCCSP